MVSLQRLFFTLQQLRIMPLLLSGKGFRRDLERFGCMAIKVPLEGGSETRLLRRLRSNGYKTKMITARGLGDPEVFLFDLHGIRPPHLGHQSVGRNGAVGEVQQVIPQIIEFLDEDSPLALWILEGQVLSHSELVSLNELCQSEQRLKIIVEMGGARNIQWDSMKKFLEG